MSKQATNMAEKMWIFPQHWRELFRNDVREEWRMTYIRCSVSVDYWLSDGRDNRFVWHKRSPFDPRWPTTIPLNAPMLCSPIRWSGNTVAVLDLVEPQSMVEPIPFRSPWLGRSFSFDVVCIGRTSTADRRIGRTRCTTQWWQSVLALQWPTLQQCMNDQLREKNNGKEIRQILMRVHFGKANNLLSASA